MEQVAEQALDHVYDWIWQMGELQGIIPPFCVEITLVDGSRHYLHSIPSRNMQTLSLVLRVWDLRAFRKEELLELRAKLDGHCTKEDLGDPHTLHPKLDWADIRLHLQNINYAIEWNDTVWPREERPQFGFIK